MKRLIVFLIFCGFLAMFVGGFFAPQASAIPGDVNGNGTACELGDIVYLISYLFQGGAAPPNPIDADIDGSPGINMGDVLQLIGCFPGSCGLLPYTGASVRVGSEIRFSSDLISFLGSFTQETTYVKIIQNGGPDLMGMVIPLSYSNRPNEVEVNLSSVSFPDTSIIPSNWDKRSVIDNVNKRVLLYPYADQSSDTPLDSGTIGVVAILYFNKMSDGTPLAMSATEIPPSHSFMLISSYCADGTSPSKRIFSPKLSLALNGDANCDGIVSLGDIVYVVNYLYKHGPPPCGM